MAQLRNPAYYISWTEDSLPLQTQLPEGVTMPVFSTVNAAQRWIDAYNLGLDRCTVQEFRTLEDVERFAVHYGSDYQHIAINPAPDPNVSPHIHPFNKLIEIAEAEAHPSPQSIEAPFISATPDEFSATMSVDQPPVEIKESLDRFKKDYPDPTKAAFIIMEFGNTWVHEAITEAVKKALGAHGIVGIRADDKSYHDELFNNILTHLHGCGLGVAIYERIKTEAQNPNVALEVGYLFALRKPVCLLKDQTLAALPADLVGRLYHPFDPLGPAKTIPQVVSKWLSDKGLA